MFLLQEHLESVFEFTYGVVILTFSYLIRFAQSSLERQTILVYEYNSQFVTLVCTLLNLCKHSSSAIAQQ